MPDMVMVAKRAAVDPQPLAVGLLILPLRGVGGFGRAVGNFPFASLPPLLTLRGDALLPRRAWRSRAIPGQSGEAARPCFPVL